MINRRIDSAVIVGPTGVIGTALCRRLAECGIRVYAVCRPDSARISALPQSRQIVTVLCDASELSRLPELIPGGADAFYHFAWGSTTGDGRNDMPSQVNNIRNTIEAVRAAGALRCKVFLGAGSQAEYGRVEGPLRPETPCFPENGYGIAKLCAGQMSRVEAHRLGMEHIWTRVLSIYGPGDNSVSVIPIVIRKLKQGEMPALTAGEQQWDYLYSDDAAEAFYLLARHGVDGKVYPVGSGEVRPLREYMEMLRDAVDPELPLGFGQIPYGPQQVMYLRADISQLRGDTGFSPQVPFAEGIRRTVQSIR